MVKIAVISLACRGDETTPSAALERELRENLIHSDRISSRWTVEKVTIIDDIELTERRPFANQTFNINRSGNHSRITH